MAFYTSLLTFSSLTSPLTVHPWIISGNYRLPVLFAPNLSAKTLMISPFGLISAGSFPAGNIKAGALICLVKSTGFPPKICYTPSDGCIPAMATIWSNSQAILKANQTPQQNPTTKNLLCPFSSKCLTNPSNLALITPKSCPLMLATIFPMSISPLYGSTKSSGK